MIIELATTSRVVEIAPPHNINIINEFDSGAISNSR